MTHPVQRAVEATVGVTAGGTGIAVWFGYVQGVAAWISAVGGAVIVCITLYRMLRNSGKGE